MEVHPGVFVSNISTEEWQADPEIGGGAEEHVLVDTGAMRAGLSRFASDADSQPPPWVLPQTEILLVLEGAARIEIEEGPTLDLRREGRHQRPPDEERAEQADHEHDHRAAREGEDRRQLLVVDDRGLDLGGGEQRAHRITDNSGAAGRAIACVVSRSVRCTTKCGYTPSATTIATSGATAARFTRSMSRDSTTGPTRPCIVPW
jgi:hypothetical protein